MPLAFLPLRSWWVLMALPGAAIVLLANSGYVWRMGDHYAASVDSVVARREPSCGRRIAGAARRAGSPTLDDRGRWRSASSFLSPSIRCTRCIICIRITAIWPMRAARSAAFRRMPRFQRYDEWFSTVAAQRPERDDRPSRRRRVPRLCARFSERRESNASMRPIVSAERRPAVSTASSAAIGNIVTYQAAGVRSKICAGRAAWATLRGLLPVPFRRFPGILARYRRRVTATSSRLRCHGVRTSSSTSLRSIKDILVTQQHAFSKSLGTRVLAVAARRRVAHERGSAPSADAAHRAAGISPRAHRGVRAHNGARRARVCGSDCNSSALRRARSDDRADAAHRHRDALWQRRERFCASRRRGAALNDERVSRDADADRRAPSAVAVAEHAPLLAGAPHARCDHLRSDRAPAARRQPTAATRFRCSSRPRPEAETGRGRRTSRFATRS